MFGAGTASETSRKGVEINQLSSLVTAHGRLGLPSGQAWLSVLVAGLPTFSPWRVVPLVRPADCLSRGLTAEQTACIRVVLGGPGHVAM